MAVVRQSGQYVQTDKDCQPVVPQPGDVEITDAFGNVFDNFNADWIDYDKDNVAKSPQPAYQNLDYVSYLADNTADPVTWEPDAAQWIPRGVDNQVRSVQPYVKSPLYPNGIPLYGTISTIEVVLQVEASEALIVTEDDINEIELVNTQSLPQVQAFIRSEGS